MFSKHSKERQCDCCCDPHGGEWDNRKNRGSINQKKQGDHQDHCPEFSCL